MAERVMRSAATRFVVGALGALPDAILRVRIAARLGRSLDPRLAAAITDISGRLPRSRLGVLARRRAELVLVFAKQRADAASRLSSSYWSDDKGRNVGLDVLRAQEWALAALVEVVAARPRHVDPIGVLLTVLATHEAALRSPGQDPDGFGLATLGEIARDLRALRRPSSRTAASLALLVVLSTLDHAWAQTPPPACRVEASLRLRFPKGSAVLDDAQRQAIALFVEHIRRQDSGGRLRVRAFGDSKRPEDPKGLALAARRGRAAMDTAQAAGGPPPAEIITRAQTPSDGQLDERAVIEVVAPPVTDRPDGPTC